VAIAVHILPGTQYMMRSLTLVGLDLNGEAADQAHLDHEGSKVFNPDYPTFWARPHRRTVRCLGATRPT